MNDDNYEEENISDAAVNVLEMMNNGLRLEKDTRTAEEVEIDRINNFIENERNRDNQLIVPLTENALRYAEGCGLDFQNSGFQAKDLVVGMVAPFIENLAIKHLVGVQPMLGPVGLIYKLAYCEIDQSTNPEINDLKVSLEMQSVAVAANSRKIDIGVSIDDDFSLVGVDTGEQLNLPKTITNDIYEEIKTDIAKIAHTDTVDVTDNHDAGKILTIIEKYTNEIARNTRRGCANWAIVSDTVSEIIKTKLRIDPCLSPRQYGYLNYIGSIYGVAIYCDEKIKHNKILLGYKGGNGESDSGYWYCPYIPLMTGGAVVSATTFKPAIGFMTRYGKATNQHSETIEYEVENSNKTEVKTTYEKCDYFYNVTLEGLPNTDLLKIKHKATGELTLPNKKEPNEDISFILGNTFDYAMDILD